MCRRNPINANNLVNQIYPFRGYIPFVGNLLVCLHLRAVINDCEIISNKALSGGK